MLSGEEKRSLQKEYIPAKCVWGWLSTQNTFVFRELLKLNIKNKPEVEMGKGLSRHFLKEDHRSGHANYEKVLSSLVPRKMPLKHVGWDVADGPNETWSQNTGCIAAEASLQRLTAGTVAGARVPAGSYILLTGRLEDLTSTITFHLEMMKSCL